MALPFLPGHSFNNKLGQEKFHKSQHFGMSNDVSMLLGEHKPGIGGAQLLGQKPKPNRSNIPQGQGNAAPAWVAFDRQVLRFDAFFQEGVHEKPEEQYRVRECKIYFYLEDDSIQVNEPQVNNSGIPQGTLIKRHRIPLPPPNDDQCYTVEHFNVGTELTLYGRTFKITGCDQFTFNFLRKLGIRVNAPDNTPDDPHQNYRKQMDESQQPLRPYEKVDTLKQFLDHDRHVLRFYCFWNDTEKMFGDVREMILHYFLADDTVEIKEFISPNSGRDATPMFLRRARLPKGSPEALKQPGEITGRTVLNVFGPMGHGGRYILDSLKTGAVITDYYTDQDLMVGVAINFWGRKLILADCDDFTKKYYSTKYGIADFAPVPFKGAGPTAGKREWPPYTGFGSEEDSLCSCMGLLPKPPRRDFIKFMEKDRHGLESNVLRFKARLDTTKPIDMDRRFIISYFLSDDTVAVFEPPVRNSGIIGGKFLERERIKKPDQERFGTELSEYFTAKDLYVGSRVKFHGHFFILTDADEYAFRYMENHQQEFAMGNIAEITAKLSKIAVEQRELIKDFFKRNDPGSTGLIEYDQFRSLLVQLAGSSLSEHEIMTVARYYSNTQENKLDLPTLVAISQDQLKKAGFEKFPKLADGFAHHDTDNSGFLDVEHVRSTCKAFRVPLPADLLRTLLDKMEKDNNGCINYYQLVAYLNWREHPAGQAVQSPVQFDGSWKGREDSANVTSVNYMALLQAVLGGGN